MVQHYKAIASYSMKLHQGPLDSWSIRERLALACSVKKNGDQNWVSVSRAVKPYAESSRPSEWSSQKNCALQYAELLEKVEMPKRKRGDHGELETTENQIARKLTIERIEELKRLVVDEQKTFKILKKQVELIRSGQWDDKLKDIWDQKQRSKKETESVKTEDQATQQSSPTKLQTEGSLKSKKLQPKPLLLPTKTNISEQKDGSQADTHEPEQPVTDFSLSEQQLSSTNILVTSTPECQATGAGQDQKTKVTPPSSPLLSSLLQSQVTSLCGLQQIKQEAEQEHAQKAKELLGVGEKEITTVEVSVTPPPPISASDTVQPSPSSAAPTLSKLLHLPAVQNKTAILDSLSLVTNSDEEIPDLISVEIKKEPFDVEEKVVTSEQKAAESEAESVDSTVIKSESPEKIKIEQLIEEDTELPDTPSFISLDEEISIKEEPSSPASSASSRMSEGGSRGRRGKSRTSRGGKKSSRLIRRPTDDDDHRDRDDASSRHSDVDTSDDETVPESDDTLSLSASLITAPGGGTLSESIPNSPLSHCSDTEDEKAYKTWKKSIMLVWRAAATHKYANVFLHPVTEEIAPGYHSIVHKPMDLITIKKNIENGSLRTTTEFQRDMMLMFTNAVMYNSSNHNVYKMAVVMYEDVMQHIEQYVNTQLMVQSNETKILRPSRRSEKSESSDKEEELKRKRVSSEISTEGGKTKKRKTRADDT